MDRRQALKAWSVLAWLLIWQLASMAVGKEILLVSPLRTLGRLFELATAPSLWLAAGRTARSIALGFSLATVLGSLLALLSARFPLMRDFWAPFMRAVRTVPVASFIIVALIWFSSRHLAALISFLMVLPILYGHVLDGIGAVDPALTEMALLFRVSPLRRLLHIELPQVMPYFRTGCRLALGLCWKAGVAAELIGTPAGSIGEKLQQARVYLETPDVFAWTVLIVLISIAFERAVLLLLHLAESRMARL